MGKLRMLKPKIKTIDTRTVNTINTTRNPDAVQRVRGRAWMVTRERWLRNNPLCCMCQAQGYVTIATQLDHIVPLIDGGADDESNYQSLCLEHHKSKTAEENSTRGRGDQKSTT